MGPLTSLGAGRPLFAPLPFGGDRNYGAQGKGVWLRMTDLAGRTATGFGSAAVVLQRLGRTGTPAVEVLERPRPVQRLEVTFLCTPAPAGGALSEE